MPMPAGRPAVFLDRDGVITALRLERGPRETARTPDEVELLPGAKEALTALRRAGFLCIVVTNQPNIAKGKTTTEAHAGIERRVAELLGPDAAPDALYTCLHHPDRVQVVVPELWQVCTCRKPQPGLLLRAAQEHGVDCAQSVMIGDTAADVEAGKRAGCWTVRLTTPWSPLVEGELPADVQATSLVDAAPAVLHLLGSASAF